MLYVNEAVGSVHLPKLIGSYERELTASVEAICEATPELIVDIGAAEGYYAVGLARRVPTARVLAFETEEKGRHLLSEMARLNGVDARVEIRGKCEPTDLQKALAEIRHPVVICDTEGYEDHLIDPLAVPALRRAVILLEMHDFVQRGLTQKIQARFASTHQVEHIQEELRHRREFPWNSWSFNLLPHSYFLDRTLSERRPERMSWLWMRPNET